MRLPQDKVKVTMTAPGSPMSGFWRFRIYRVRVWGLGFRVYRVRV